MISNILARLRGEPFLDGKPVSYWVRVILAGDTVVARPAIEANVAGPFRRVFVGAITEAIADPKLSDRACAVLSKNINEIAFLGIPRLLELAVSVSLSDRQRSNAFEVIGNVTTVHDAPQVVSKLISWMDRPLIIPEDRYLVINIIKSIVNIIRRVHADDQALVDRAVRAISAEFYQPASHCRDKVIESLHWMVEGSGQRVYERRLDGGVDPVRSPHSMRVSKESNDMICKVVRDAENDLDSGVRESAIGAVLFGNKARPRDNCAKCGMHVTRQKSVMASGPISMDQFFSAMSPETLLKKAMECSRCKDVLCAVCCVQAGMDKGIRRHLCPKCGSDVTPVS